MDKALELKIKFNNNELKTYKEAKEYLDKSELFHKLLSDFELNTLNLLWRLTQLSEIPFSGHNKIVKEWHNKLIDLTYTEEGFSLNGKDDYLMACYNGMITSILIKLGNQDIEQVSKGVSWIIKYQNVKRGEICNWKGSAIKKYGGCMKKVPCYIGLVKSMIALSDYKHLGNYNKNVKLESKLKDGLEYILNQNIFLRLSDNKPISNEITKLTYPFTWKTNVIEILRLINNNKLLNDKRCVIAQDYLRKKLKKDGFWWAQSSNIQRSEVWVPFDKSRQQGKWISHEIANVL